MNKAYFYTMCLITSILIIIAIFGTSNHFLKFYEVKGSNNSSSSNNNNDPKKPQVDPKDLPVVDGYNCLNLDCKKLETNSISSENVEIILDGENQAIIYNKETKEVERTYKTIKESGKLYIVVNSSGLYGLVSIGDEITDVFDAKYKHIDYNEKDNQFMVTTNTASFITDENGSKLSPDYSAQIVQYNDKYIVTRTEKGDFHIFDFQNKELLREYVNTKRTYIELVGDFVGVITDNNIYRVYDFRTGTVILGEYQINDATQEVRSRINNGKIEIYDKSGVLKTIDF